MPWLERARDFGFLGPGPIDTHIRHAIAMLEALAAPLGASVVDLGSGGGVPGLIMAAMRPDLSLLFIESTKRRAEFLHDAVDGLGLASRTVVLAERAEVVGRNPQWRATCLRATARGFGPPAVVAECAAPLLVLGGVLIVSEPPEDQDRWPGSPLAAIGLTSEPVIVDGLGFRRLVKVAESAESVPRRVGVPAKRPLF